MTAAMILLLRGRCSSMAAAQLVPASPLFGDDNGRR